MSGKVRPSSRVILRNLLVYLIIIAVCIVLLAPIYIYANRLIIQGELDHYNAQLENGCATLSKIITSIYDGSSFTRNSTTFLPLRYINENEVDIVKLQEQQAIFANLFNQQLAITYAGLVFSDRLVITNDWIFFPDSTVKFYPTMFRCGTYDFNQWVSLLRSRDQRFLPEMHYFHQNRHAFDAITYVARWGNSASLFVLIPSESVLDMFTSKEHTNDIALRITDSDGTDIYCHNADLIPSCPYSVSRKLGLSGLNVTISIPSATMEYNVRKLRHILLIYVLIVLILSFIVIILYGLFSASRPLHELSRRMPFIPATSPFSVQDTYRYLSEGIANMNETINNQRSIMKKQLFEIALTRGYLSEEEMHAFHTLFSDFPSSYQLVLFRLPQDISDEQRQYIFDTLQTNFSNCYIHWSDIHSLLLVLNMAEKYEKDIGSIRENLTEHLEIPIHAFASEVYQDIDGLHAAWQQMIILESSIQAGTPSHILTPDDLPDKRPVMPLSIQDTNTFYAAVSAADTILANSILSGATEILMEQEHNTQLYRHTYLLLYRIMRQLQMENPMALGSFSLPEYNVENRVELFASLLPASVNEFCAALRKRREEQNDTPDILTYINNNLSSPDLCVDSIAFHFGISGTTLQKLCQDAAGMSVASYIENQRMQHSYQLLCQGELTIAEIARQCGYNSPNSFYKAFKRRFGIAPRSVTAENGENKKEPSA